MKAKRVTDTEEQRMTERWSITVSKPYTLADYLKEKRSAFFYLTHTGVDKLLTELNEIQDKKK